MFHVRDGYGIGSCRRPACDVAVISGRRSPMVAVRCRELGIRHVHQGVDDKLGAFAPAVRAAEAHARVLRLRGR